MNQSEGPSSSAKGGRDSPFKILSEPSNLAIDPVCGMKVDPAKAQASAVHDGVTYYFCCPSCLRKFQAEPRRYLAVPAPSTAPPSSPASAYSCPMHPEVRVDHQAACPQCGMALEPTEMLPPATKTEYFCPMHPEVVRDNPGNCPKCGMAL